MRVSVLDLGSNSFHALVADVTPTGLVEPFMRERAMLHLGAVVERHGHLPPDVADHAVATVAHLADLTRRSRSEAVDAVATSALRDASNGPEVLERFADVLGQPVRLLTGTQEAELAFRGAHAVLALRGTTWLVLDLGGGSLELAVGTNDAVTWTTSLELGVSRLATLIDDLDAPLTPDDAQAVRERVGRALSPHLDELRSMAIDEVVACGGTVRAIGTVIATRRMSWLPLSINQLPVTRKEIARAARQLALLDLAGREAVPGMKERRADRLHVAGLILSTVLELIAVAGCTISDGGIREGALLELVGVAPPGDRTAMRDLAARYVRDAWTPDDAHSDHVVHLAERLFDQTQALHGLDADARDMVRHGALLHDVGLSVALKGHHRHGAYLVENAALPGFTPVEVAQLATLTRFHRDGRPNREYDPFDALGETDRERTVRMLALVQLADGLDRARDQHVTDISIAVDGRRLVLGLSGEHLHLARADVTRKGQLFAELFGVELVLNGDLEEEVA